MGYLLYKITTAFLVVIATVVMAVFTGIYEALRFVFGPLVHRDADR